MPDWNRIADRHGVLTLSDARASGVRDAQWARALRVGDLIAAHHAVALVPSAPHTRIQAIAAAVASLRPGGLASHRAAIDLWTDRLGDGPIDVIVPRRSWPAPRPGVVIHRPRDRRGLQPSYRLGIRCTSPLRVLLDVGAVAPERVDSALEDLIVSGLVTIAAVDAAIERHTVQGRDGLGALRSALRHWPLGDAVPDSALEIRLARMLVIAGLTEFTFHRVIHGMEVDFAFERERLVIETDGWEFHGSRDAFEEDRRRDVELVAAGWRVIRLTWQQITGQPDWVIERVRSAMRWSR